jgi:hypothetical protein
MDLPCTRRVEPVCQSPRTEMYGYFTHGTVPPFRPYSSGLASLPDHLRRLPSPTHSGRRLRGHAAFTALKVLLSRPTTGRASLAISLALIGSLTPVPPGDPVSPPEVTHCSSVPCRPQTPWCGGWMRNAFASIMQARPCPTFGRPVHRRGSPHRLRPGTSPQTLRIPPRDGHPALRSYCEQRLQVRLGCIQLSPACPFRLLHTACSLSGQRGFTPAFGYDAPHPSIRGTLTLLNNALLSAHCRALRLPAALPASLGFLRFAVPSLRLGFAPVV